MNNGFLSSIGDEWLNTNPNAAWQFVFGDLLRGGNQNFNKWLRGQQGDMYQEYQAEVARDPNLRALDFYRSKSPWGEFLKLDPKSRGVDLGAMQPRINFKYGIGQ